MASFIRIEEGRAYQRGREEVEPAIRMGRERRCDRRMFGKSEGGSGQRGADQRRAPHYVHHTPLNALRARVMEEALRVNLLTVVRSPTPLDTNESKYCRYHQNRGHTTEDCITLKDKLESLVQAGHLQNLVQRSREGSSCGAGHPFKRNFPPKGNERQKEDRSRSKSRERSVKGIINTIFGGFAGGGSTVSARKRHFRNLHSVNRAEVLRKSMPTITFSNKNFHALDLDQDD